MSQIKSMMKAGKRNNERKERIRLRKHLNADALFAATRDRFSKIDDHRTGNNVEIPLADALMSGFAMFSLKDSSLLEFDNRRLSEPYNLHTIYGIGRIPCDSAMRQILDGVDPDALRPAFKDAFRQLQRGKVLEKMKFFDDGYLLCLDGTGYFSSTQRHSPDCLTKTNSKTGDVSYHLQTVGAAIVHPDRNEVIVLCPEMIRKQDGETKNDCERNAVRRLLTQMRREHPHLPLIINEDALSSNAPHIRDLQEFGYHYILGIKPGDHKFLFDYVDSAAQREETTDFVVEDDNNPHIFHCFRILNDVPLNKSNQDLRVNFIEYCEKNTKTGKTKRFSWITDFTLTKDNAMQIMRGGRARWKIENETFNTLKNQGYNFEHNYGLGKKHLSTVFVMLMMLAFLVDQIQQLCCQLFNAVWKKRKTKKNLWQTIRALFHSFIIQSMEELYRAILERRPRPLSD